MKSWFSLFATALLALSMLLPGKVQAQGPVVRAVLF